MQVVVPFEAKAQLPGVLRDINSAVNLGVNSVGIATTNLEDVFLKVAAGRKDVIATRQSQEPLSIKVLAPGK